MTATPAASRWLTTIVLATLTASPAVAQVDSVSHRYAFLIGVDDYGTHRDDSLDNLSYCRDDVEGLRVRLEAIGFRRIYCMTTRSTLSWQPTRERIQRKLLELLADESLDANDLVLVALAGHGLEHPDPDDSKKNIAYFCPADAHSERTGTLIPINWFYDKLADSPAGIKLLVVDACRDLAKTRGGSRPTLSRGAGGFMRSMDESRPPRGIAAFLSCQSKQFSHEVPDLGHGVFMHYIIEGLSKADLAAGNRDGDISLSELFNYASDQTEHYVENESPVRLSRQTPILRGDLPNYKIVTGLARPEPRPTELDLSFTVRGGSTTGAVLSGASVSLIYRSQPSEPEVTLARLTSDSRGRCQTSLKSHYADALGEFVASVSHGGATKRWRLTGFPGSSRTWSLYIPESPKSATEYTNSVGMKFRLIPAGEFDMGSPTTEEDRDDEQQHRVRITQSFYLGIHEVTQDQWRKVMGSQLGDLKDDDWDWHGEGSDYPMYWVSWYDAVAFCNALSESEGKRPYYGLKNIERETYGAKPGIDSADVTILGGNGYRLPSEAQWEYACRAGTTTPFHFGGVLNGTQANCDGDYPYGTTTKGPDLGETRSVGSYSANAWGLYEMHGNVREWCEDWYDGDYYANSPTADPTGPSTPASYRVDRGGGWNGSAGGCRAANRAWHSPGNRSLILGFRLALVPSE